MKLFLTITRVLITTTKQSILRQQNNALALIFLQSQVTKCRVLLTEWLLQVCSHPNPDPTAPDITLYEAKHFCKLVLEGDPFMLEVRYPTGRHSFCAVGIH